MLRGSEARRAETGTGRGSTGVRKACCQGCCSYVVGGAALTNIPQTDIFHVLGIEIGAGIDLLEQLEDHLVETRVFHGTATSLGQRSPDRKRDDYIVGVLLGDLVDGTGQRIQLGYNLGYALGCHCYE